MKLCRTCRFGKMYELDKPCVVYREDCPLYQKEGDGMNREEAIKILENEHDNHINGCKGVFYETRTEALDMAIKALEQDNCPYYVIDEDGHGLCKNHRLEQEPSGDLISRQYLLDNCVVDKVTMPYVPISKIQEAPSVNPQEPKTGHWILDETDNSITCDKCGCLIWANDISNGEAYYCPNCGAKMVESQESDHKCHDCKHYTSGEYDGSCDSYICNGYSDWESEDKE